jgi:hypothetical protein
MIICDIYVYIDVFCPLLQVSVNVARVAAAKVPVTSKLQVGTLIGDHHAVYTRRQIGLSFLRLIKLT